MGHPHLLLTCLAVATQPALRDFAVLLEGDELRFTGILDGNNEIDSVQLVYGAVGLPPSRAVMERRGHDLHLAVDGRPLLLGKDSVRLAYSVAAVDVTGEVVAHLGTPEEPLEVIVTRVFDARALDVPEDPLVTRSPPGATDAPWHETWWFWTAAALVLLGSGITAGFVLTSH